MHFTNLLKKLFCPLLFSILAAACQQEGFIQRPSEECIYEQIGKMHNEGLACILNEMENYRSHNILNGTTQEDILSVANQSLSSIVITKASGLSYESDLLSDSITVMNFEKANSLDSAITTEFFNAFSGCYSTADIKDNLLRLRERLHSEQSDSLLIASYDSGITVALASLDYWKDNYQRWYVATHILQEAPATKSGIINGRVLDHNQEPIVGAAVQVQGTTFGTVTNIDGDFSLNMPLGYDTIVVSYIGYETATISLSGNTTIVVTLADDAQSLWDIIAPVASADGIGAISATATSLALGPLSWQGVALGALVGSLSYCLQQVLP